MNEPIEVEMVPSNAVAVRPQQGALANQTIADLEQAFALAVKQRELIASYIKTQLKPDKHFYHVPGCKKPSLTKEGAEIILLPHGLIPDYEMISGPQEPPEADKPYQIVVKCILRNKGNSESICGTGLGSASSHITSRDRGRIPRQKDPGLRHNATLKMAQKSALVAATQNSTASSEFFTQDMEDAGDSGEPSFETSQNAPGRAGGYRDTTPPVKVAPKPTVSATDTAESLLTASKAKFIKLVEPLGEFAWAYLVHDGYILDNERIEDVSPTKLFPHFNPETYETQRDANRNAIKEDFDTVMAAIQNLVDNSGGIEPQLKAKFDAAYAVKPGDSKRPVCQHCGSSENVIQMQNNALPACWSHAPFAAVLNHSLPH